MSPQVIRERGRTNGRISVAFASTTDAATEWADAPARPRHPFTPFPRSAIEQSLVARFEEAAQCFADRLAVVTPSVSWTYNQLDARANAIANALVERSGSGSEPVCLLMDQGAPLIVATLGVLKAGKFYVPLDPNHNPEHSRALLNFVGSRTVITQAQHVPAAAQLGLSPNNLLRVEEWLARQDAKRLTLPIQPHDPAYVFFTSGTTGHPKGVLDNHRNVLHNTMRYTNALHIRPDDRLTLIQAATFSGTVSTLFSALLNGACLLPFDVRVEGFVRLAEWMKTAGATVYHSVPSIFREVATAGGSFPSVRLVRLEGDRAARADWELFCRVFPVGSSLANGLGTTETGLCRQFFADHQSQLTGATLPIGYPLPDFEVQVRRENGEPAQPGEIGELTVASEFLAVGYWRNEELSRARFRPDPNAPQRRVYHTGDLGRMATNGCVEYLGRQNFEEKINGQWVDCAALEETLRAVAGVREVAVITRPDPGGTIRLVAFIVAQGGATVSAEHLRKRLAEEMPAQPTPSAFIQLPALPLNEHRKVDRAALREFPWPANAHDTPIVAPQTELERQVATVWEEILNVRPVGVTDNFFALGGESLLAARLAARLEKQLGCRVSPSAFLKTPTIEQFLSCLDPEPGES